MVIVVLAGIGGCASAPSIADLPPAPIYGRFCGLGYPALPNNLSRDDQIEQLEEIEVKQTADGRNDAIDFVCKQHDVCYTSNGNFDSKCNEQLRDDIAELNFSTDGELGQRCSVLADDIDTWFRLAPQVTRGGSYWSTLGDTAHALIGVPFLALESIVFPKRAVKFVLNSNYPRGEEVCLNQEFDYPLVIKALTSIHLNLCCKPNSLFKKTNSYIAELQVAAARFSVVLQSIYYRHEEKFAIINGKIPDNLALSYLGQGSTLYFMNESFQRSDFPLSKKGAPVTFVEKVRQFKEHYGEVSGGYSTEGLARMTAVQKCLDAHDEEVNKRINEVISAGNLGICIKGLMKGWRN
jgi:hypothetical protein